MIWDDGSERWMNPQAHPRKWNGSRLLDWPDTARSN